MPRNGSGTFSILTPIQIGALRSSSAVNADFADAGDEITNSLPIDGTAGMNGTFKAADGEQTEPGIAFVADLNTGFRRSAPDEMRWVAGGIDRAILDEDGALTFLNGIDVAGSVNFSTAIVPQSLFATDAVVMALGREENDTSEHELMSYEVGDGSGAKASLRVVGGAANNVATMRFYVNDVKVFEWTSTLFSHAVDVAYGANLRAGTDGYFDITEIVAPSAPTSNIARLYCRDASGISTLFYKTAAGEQDIPTDANRQVFTSSNTWSKPSEGTIALIEAWGGGGGGAIGAGGGGGAYVRRIMPLSALAGTVSVTVGAGGNSSDGGNSSFGSHVTAYGGAVAQGGGSGGPGAGGGGLLAKGVQAGAGGTPNGRLGADTWGGNDGESNPFGGGGDGLGGTNIPASFFGGGGGAGTGGNPGASIFGGGGGGFGGGGISVYGGNGGVGSAGSAPGGGGDNSASGARGEVRITVW
ncbi:hypothetical protein [Rhodomicrobium sp. R_RK_3]|nr:hypothetical protein [Rhodomicrobium sp. R_RK_3]